MGNTINLWSGVGFSFIIPKAPLDFAFQGWIKPEVTGVGAGIDSFYEYALKWYILSGKVQFSSHHISFMRHIQARLSFLMFGTRHTLPSCDIHEVRTDSG